MGTVPFFRPLQTRINKGLSHEKINFDTFFTNFKMIKINNKNKLNFIFQILNSDQNRAIFEKSPENLHQ